MAENNIKCTDGALVFQSYDYFSTTDHTAQVLARGLVSPYVVRVGVSYINDEGVCVVTDVDQTKDAVVQRPLTEVLANPHLHGLSFRIFSALATPDSTKRFVDNVKAYLAGKTSDSRLDLSTPDSVYDGELVLAAFQKAVGPEEKIDFAIPYSSLVECESTFQYKNTLLGGLIPSGNADDWMVIPAQLLFRSALLVPLEKTTFDEVDSRLSSIAIPVMENKEEQAQAVCQNMMVHHDLTEWTYLSPEQNKNPYHVFKTQTSEKCMRGDIVVLDSRMADENALALLLKNRLDEAKKRPVRAIEAVIPSPDALEEAESLHEQIKRLREARSQQESSPAVEAPAETAAPVSEQPASPSNP